MTEWGIDEGLKLEAVDGADTEEYSVTTALSAETEIKVVYSEDGTTATTWFPSGGDNNYVIAADGVYTVYFRPNYDGNDDWYEKVLYVAGEEVEPTTSEPASEPETEEPTEPETQEPTGESQPTETITVYFTDAQGYGDVNVYYWPNGGDWPGVAMTKTEVNEYLQQVYTAEIPADTTGIIFNGNGRQTVDILEGITDGAWWYTVEQTDDTGHNYVQLVGEPTTEEHTSAPETEEPTDEPQPVNGGYYLVGTMTEWGIDQGLKLEAVDGAGTEEYSVTTALTAETEIKVVYSEDGTTATTWFPSGGDNNYVIAADGVYTVYFRPNYDGNDDWYEKVLYVAGEEVEPTTSEPASEPETEEPTDEPAPTEGGYYIVGTMTGWAIDADYQLTANEAAEGEYVFTGLNLTADSDQFKVVYSEDGETATTWYPEGMGNNYGENGEITETNVYDVYFRPDGQGGEDWFYNCIYVAAQGEPEQPTEEVTTAAPEEPTDEPQPGVGGYYLVGTMTEWGIDQGLKLEAVDGADTEEYSVTAALSAETEIKVVYSEDGNDSNDMVPSGGDNNYVIAADGVYTVYFRPNYDGNDDWYEKVLYVAGEEVEPTTSEPASEPETEEPTDEPAPTEGGYYIVGTMTGWAIDADYQLTANEAAEGEYVFTGLNLTADSDQFKVVYSEDGETATTWYPEGMGNNYGENGEITETNVYDVYFRPDGQGGEDWFYNCIYVAAQGEPEQPTEEVTTAAPEEPTDEPAPTEGGYYIVGTMTGWAIDADYQLTANEAAEGEYVFTGLNLTADSDQFKVVYSEDGETATTWYPEGMGNNYGENGEITETNVYDVYFRPDGQGGEDWFYNCIYVAAQGEPEQPTEEVTTAAPEEPTDEPQPVNGGYYIVGTMTEWGIDEGLKLEAVDGADTEEYSVTTTLSAETEIKVVYSKTEQQQRHGSPPEEITTT